MHHPSEQRCAIALLAGLWPSLVALGAALAVSAVVVALAGGNPLLAIRALGEGAFGSLDGLSEVGVKTCPLLLTGVAVALAFRAGIWNIGAEGQLLLGAVTMAWLGASVSAAPTWLALPLALLASAAAGGLWAGVAAVLKLRRGVDEVISTIMLNFVALGLLSYLVHGPLMETSGAYPQSDAVSVAMRLPRLVEPYRVHAGLLVALAITAAAGIVLFRTVFGYEMRAVGGNPRAAELAGIRINWCLFFTLVLSGAVAGLAGGIEVSAVTHRLYERFSPGYGFTAIAVALLGRLHPAGVAVAALFFGALEAGSNSMQRVAGVSAVLVLVIQATVIFALIGVEHGIPRRAPRSQRQDATHAPTSNSHSDS
jgi:general nucleoside transport system permease protein